MYEPGLTETVINAAGQVEIVPVTPQRYLELHPELRLRITPARTFTIPASGEMLASCLLQLVNALDEPVAQTMPFTGVLNNGEDTRQLNLNAQGRLTMAFGSIRAGRNVITSPQFPGTEVVINCTPAVRTVNNPNVPYYLIGRDLLILEQGEPPSLDDIYTMNLPQLRAVLRRLIIEVRNLRQEVDALTP